MRIPACLLQFCFSLLLLGACTQRVSDRSAEKGHAADASEMAAADSVDKQMTALSNGSFTDRKFIRSSELEFKVDNVREATEAINEIVQKAGGFVIYSKLSSNINQSAETELSRDSSLEFIRYTVQNNMKIRVPTIRFDTVLSSILPLANFIDNQIIQMDDVSFEVLSNHMTIRRAATGARKNTKESADLNAYQQEEADRAKVNNLSLSDRIRYSDISLAFSQRSLVKQTVIANEEKAMEYQPGFGSKILTAFIKGWHLIEWLFLTIIQLWSLILAGLALWFLFRKFRKGTNSPRYPD